MVRRIPRRVARAPIWLYRHNLGWLLGGRFALLEHRGRVSGLPRQVVLEVLSHGPGQLTVVSGYGRAAQWYRNILADPRVRVWSGRWSGAPARATPLPTDVAVAALSDYRRHHPHARVCWSGFWGFRNWPAPARCPPIYRIDCRWWTSH